MRPCCQVEGCKSPAAPQRRKCWAHARCFPRCQTPECGKRAQYPRYTHCVRHGGGYRCTAPDCGRSRQFRYLFCRWHLPKAPKGDACELADQSSNVTPLEKPS